MLRPSPNRLCAGTGSSRAATRTHPRPPRVSHSHCIAPRTKSVHLACRRWCCSCLLPFFACNRRRLSFDRFAPLLISSSFSSSVSLLVHPNLATHDPIADCSCDEPGGRLKCFQKQFVCPQVPCPARTDVCPEKSPIETGERFFCEEAIDECTYGSLRCCPGDDGIPETSECDRSAGFGGCTGGASVRVLSFTADSPSTRPRIAHHPIRLFSLLVRRRWLHAVRAACYPVRGRLSGR